MKFCPFCGFALDGSEKFCRDCGKELPKSEPVPSPTPMPDPQPKVASMRRDVFLSAILPMPLCVVSSLVILINMLLDMSYYYNGFNDAGIISVFAIIFAATAVFLVPTSLIYGLVSVLTVEKQKLRAAIAVALAVVFALSSMAVSNLLSISTDVPMALFYVIDLMFRYVLIAFVLLQGALVLFGVGRSLAKSTKLQVIVTIAYTILCFILSSFLVRFINASEETVFASLAVAAFFALVAAVIKTITSASRT